MKAINDGCQQAALHATLDLCIAGWSIEVRAVPPALAELLAPRYETYRVLPSENPDLVVEVQHEAVGSDEARTVSATSILQGALTFAGDEYRLDSDRAYGIISLSQRRAALRLRSPDPAPEVEYFLRVVLALFALSHDGLLIHCAALKRSDVVHLFIGQSGSGKSTVVALSRAAGQAAALGDDMIVVRREGDGWQAYGTPFWNMQTASHEGEHETGRVASIYKLIQDRTVYIEPVGRAAATAELVANCPVVNGLPALLPAVIDRCREIAGAVNVARLHFRKDDSFWTVMS